METTRYGLKKIGPNDKLSDNDYQFGTTDRDSIDSVLYLGAKSHLHTGAAATLGDPSLPPAAVDGVLSSTLVSGNAVYYKYTWRDAGGLESAPGPSVSHVIGSGISSPLAPSLVAALTTGTLASGSYYYTLTCYVTTNTNEGMARNQAYTLLAPTATGKITLTMPSPPVGVTGFNIYRKAPGEVQFNYLASIPVATLTYVDNGGVSADTGRHPPATTGSAKSIVVSALVVDPSAVAWVLYRSYDNANWTNTRIASGTGATYEDVGVSVQPFSPPALNLAWGTPSKIQLTDSAEVQGSAPMGRISGYPIVWQHHFDAPVSSALDPALWFCDYPQATILDARVVIDHGSVANGGGLSVDIIKKNNGATPSTATIYPSTPKPAVIAGSQVGTRAAPDVATISSGDYLYIDPVVSSTVGYTVIVRLVASAFGATTSRILGSQADWA